MESLEESLKALKLPVLAERLDGWLETAAKQNGTPREFLERVVAEELSEKRGKRTEMGVRMARFPFVKTLDGFDFDSQPSLDPKRIRELATCRWVANGDNVIFRASGRGKDPSLGCLGSRGHPERLSHPLCGCPVLDGWPRKSPSGGAA